MTDSRPMPKKLRFSHRLTLYSVLSLMLLYICTNLFAKHINWTVMLVPFASLLMFVPGIVIKSARNFDWLCFVILLHFTVGVSNAMSPNPSWDDYLQTLLSVMIFIGSMMTSRWLKAWKYQHNTDTSNR